MKIQSTKNLLFLIPIFFNTLGLYLYDTQRNIAIILSEIGILVWIALFSNFIVNSEKKYTLYNFIVLAVILILITSFIQNLFSFQL